MWVTWTVDRKERRERMEEGMERRSLRLGKDKDSSPLVTPLALIALVSYPFLFNFSFHQLDFSCLVV